MLAADAASGHDVGTTGSDDTHEGVQLVEIPFAMKLLTQELNAVSIAMRYELEPLQ